MIRIIAVFLLVFAANLALAADLTVYPDGIGGTHPTIAAAVADAASGDRILLGAGTFSGPGNRDIFIEGGNLEIRANGALGTTVIDCGGSHRAFELGYSDLVFTNLIIRGGQAGLGGAISIEEGSTTITSCVFEQNTATSRGGALHAFEEAFLTLDRVTFAHNQCDGNGGALSLDTSTSAQIDNNTFVLNKAADGGHIYLAGDATAAIEQCILAWGAGGGAVSDFYAPGWSVVCSDVFGNQGGDVVQGNDNLNTDPMLCDPAAGFYRPVNESPVNNTPLCGRMGAWPGDSSWPAPVYSLEANGSGMFAKIQDAMDAIPEGAVISLGDGYYTGYHNRNLNPHGKAMTVRSRSGDPEACVIDPDASFDEPFRALILNSGEGPGTVFEDLGFDNGWIPGNGGLVYMEGPVGAVFNNCVFDDGTAYEGNNVAIYGLEEDPATPRFHGCTFKGSLYTVYTVADFEECDFSGTEAGLFMVRHGGGTIQGCHFHDLHSYAVGSGIYIGHGEEEPLELTANTFENCYADVNEVGDRGAGAALYMINPGIVSVRNCVFSGCLADSGGSDIYIYSTDFEDSLHVADSQFTGSNGASYIGGSIYARRVDVRLERNSWQGYATTFAGGALCAISTGLEILDSRFEECTGGEYGGALRTFLSPSLISGCDFIDNTADEGGAFYCFSSAAEILDCTFADNQANRGGGICILPESSGADMDIEGSVFWHNRADEGGAAIYNGNVGSDIHMKWCTVHWNEITAAGQDLGQIYIGPLTQLTLDSCLITGADTTPAVTTDEDTSYPAEILAYCTNVWGNTWGNWTGPLEGLLAGGNISADPMYCDPLFQDLTLAEGSPCLPANNYCGTRMGALDMGCSGLSPAPETPGITAVSLKGAHPNPFNPQTTISYELPREAAVTLVVHDVAGRVVRTLRSGIVETAGRHDAIWNGTNDTGRRVGSGVYLVRLVADGVSQVQRVALIK